MVHLSIDIGYRFIDLLVHWFISLEIWFIGIWFNSPCTPSLDSETVTGLLIYLSSEIDYHVLVYQFISIGLFLHVLDSEMGAGSLFYHFIGLLVYFFSEMG